MEKYYFNKEKVVKLLNKIQENLEKKSKSLEKVFRLDYEKWEIKIELEKIISLIENIKKEEYLPRFSKHEIIDGIGKIALITNSNTYIIFNFILSCIYTNNKVCVVLENKMFASNKALIEVVRKTLKEMDYETSSIDYIEVTKKEEFISKQEEFELLYYFGNKEEYINFIKRIHIDSKFENFGEIYIYVENKDFKKEFVNIDKFAYVNQMEVFYFNTEFETAIQKMNKNNNINKVAIIFTKNLEKAYEFVKQIKTENVYINKEPEEELFYKINMQNLIFKKKIML